MADMPLQVRCITVHTGRLICDVAVSERRFRFTTPAVAQIARDRFPELPLHACVNDRGKTFGAVMDDTSIAHLVEHIAITLQTRLDESGDLFAGTTEWTSESSGEARIQIGFRDDLVALRAFNEAVRFVNNAVLTCLS